VARRLSDSGAEVVLLEAGRHLSAKDDAAMHDMVHDPMQYGDGLHTDVDWQYYSTKQPQLADRKIYLPRGRAIGGTGVLNGMAFVKPPLADMDEWAAAGCAGWDGANMQSYLSSSECATNFEAQGLDREEIVANGHGLDGPQSISWGDPDRASPISHAFIAGCVEVGQKIARDYNSPICEHGVGRLQFYQRDGSRAHSGREFIDGSTVHIKPQSYVTKLSLSAGHFGGGVRCTGVEYIDADGQQNRIDAGTRVILAAGSFASPALLMRSGIGDSTHLATHGITTLMDLPGVGQNLQDHIWCPVSTLSSVPLPKEEYENHVETHLLTASSLANGRRDIQIMQCCIMSGEAAFAAGAGVPGFVLVPTVLYPKSKGSVTLTSSNVFDAPTINPNFLTDPEGHDLQVLSEVVDLARSITRTDAMSSVVRSELSPANIPWAPGGIEARSPEMEHFLRGAADTLYHPIGTCKMGVDKMAVVDPASLGVYGVDGLSIADASVIPMIVGANTNAAAAMVGEKAADLLLQQV
jgi:choline dehydrogenase